MPLEELLALRCRLLIKLVQGSTRFLAMLFGCGANGGMLLRDGTGAFGRRLRDQPGDIAGALLGGAQRYVEQIRESFETFVELFGAGGYRRREALNRVLTLADRGHGVVVGLLEQVNGIGECFGVAVKLKRQLAEIAEHPRRRPVE